MFYTRVNGHGVEVMRKVEIYVDEAVAFEVSLRDVECVSFEKEFDSIIQRVYRRFPNLKDPIDVEFMPEKQVVRLVFTKPDSREVLVYSGNHDVILNKGEYLILSEDIANSINKHDESKSDAFSGGDELMVTNVSRSLDEGIDKYTLGSYVIKDKSLVIDIDEES